MFQMEPNGLIIQMKWIDSSNGILNIQMKSLIFN